ncbi:protein AHNAK2 [Callorhinus ursinus]|uniref:protein AHNAK2 n=1 Tax=Callorhinus ursinus TaxID=34884 RepID=UPI003CD0523E
MGRPCRTLIVLPSPNLPSWASHARSFEDPSQSLGALLPSAGGGSRLPSSLPWEAAPWWLRPEDTRGGSAQPQGTLASEQLTPNSFQAPAGMGRELHLGALPPLHCVMGAGAALPHQGELSLQPKVSTAGAGSKEEAAEAILGGVGIGGHVLDGLGLGTCGVAGQQTPISWPSTCLATWGPWELRQVGRALHRGPSVLESRGSRLACTSQALLAPISHRQGNRKGAEGPRAQNHSLAPSWRCGLGERRVGSKSLPLILPPPGSCFSAHISGRQLQPEEPDADTEEDHSVTEGPVDEIIRPRPQGSSPVYEYTVEGASSGLPEDTPRRRASSGSGGRRSWWKRDSGDSQTFSRMSGPQSMQEATEVTLMTEAEAGASGYSVTGGGDQGIFVKQVLKDSSAAKLFSLREGDQLLSTTIFFDNIKYEDALKILQYSEPYKVQFQVKRKRPATEDEEGAARGAQHGPKGSEKQDKDVADGSTETPTQTLEGGGDQERLLAKPREGRRRRPQKERLSWPKFQSITSKHMPGPRRSHSSSEAYGRGDAPDVSPTSTDTEAQLPAEDQEQKAGPDGQRRGRFLNLRFRMGSGKGPTLEGRPSRGVQGGALQAGVVEEAGSCEDRQEAPEATVQSRGEDGTAEVPAGTPIEPGAPSRGALGEGASVASRRRKETKEVTDPEDAVSEGEPGVSSAPQGGEGLREVAQGMEIGIARSALQGKGDAQGRQPEFQIQIPSLKTPVFKFSKERKQDTEGGTAPLVQGHGQGGTTAQETRPAGAGAPGPQLAAPEKPKAHLPEREGGGAGGAEEGHRGRGKKDGDKDKGGREERWTVLKFNMPSFTRSPRKGARAAGEKPALASDQETGSTVTVKPLQAEGKEILEDKERDTRGGQPPGPEERGPELEREQGDLSLGDQEVAATDGKFKMPSFGASAPSKDLGTSVDVSGPRVRAEATLPSLGGEVRAPEGAVQVPSADTDLPGEELEVSPPEGEVAVSGLEGKAAGVKIKGQLPKVQMPSLKMAKVDIKAPQVDIKGPKLDLKGAKGEVSVPDMEVLLPTVNVDAQVPGAKVEGALSVGDKEVAARESKFKMPKFKMPSFSMSVPSKDLGTSVDMEVSVPKVRAEATQPSLGREVQAPEGAIQVPTADIDLPGEELEVSIPEGEVAVTGPKGKAEGVKIKGQLPKVQMPSLKMPKVDIKAPQVDIKGPKLDLKGAKGEVSTPDMEVSLPSVEVDTQVSGAKVEADLSLEVKEVAARDSKFKMPKFKMPSFGTSAPSKSLEASVAASLPKVQAEVSMPSIQADVKTSDVTIELPSADLDVKTASVGLKLPEGQEPEGKLQEPSATAGLKGHLPKVQMPSIKMPKVDFKAPQVDIRGPKLDLKGTKGEVSAPDMGVSLPTMELDTQVLGTKVEADLSIGDKEVASRDSKFKMPKFKMPSFGASVPSKDLGTSVDVLVPNVGTETTQPSLGREVRAPEGAVQVATADIDLPGGELEVSFPEGEVAVSGLKGKAEGVKIKGQLPKEQMPSLKMAKEDIKAPHVNIKAPQVDIKGPKLDLKGAKGEVRAPNVEVSLPRVEGDAQVSFAKVESDLSLEDKEVAIRDSKFKMPKFKMPSFGASVPSKDLGTSVDVSVPKVRAETTLPSLGGEVRAPEGAILVPAADIDLPVGELEVSLPEGEVPVSGLKGKAERVKIKGQLTKVQMPSLKMPKVDIKAPQVDIKGPKLDLKGVKGEVSAPDGKVSLPSMEVDSQVPDAKVEADLSVGEKEVAARDSKFKMPKFKMPSFSASGLSKSLEASADASLPKVQVEVSMPSIQADVKTSDVTFELPSADLDIKTVSVGLKLPESQDPKGELQERSAAGGLKGLLPKMQMPSIKMPKVDFKDPQVDIKGPKLDLKGAKGEVSAPDMEMSLPTVEVDAQVPEAKLEADLSVGDKEVAARDSKFKMPKFKMPSFGASEPSKDLGTSVDMSVPKVGAEATLPSLGGEVRAPEGAVQVPTADIDLPGGELEVSLPKGEVAMSGLKGKSEGVKIKGQLPKMQMPSLKMPTVDTKAPQVDIKAHQVDIKGPELDLKGTKGEVSVPDMEVFLPCMEVDAQVPGPKVEADLSLGDKEVATRDSKFKMPKFKMPSFGALVPSKSMEASVDVSLPKVQAEVSMSSIQADVKTSDVTIELPSAHLDIKTASVGLKLPEGQVPEGECQETSAAGGLKGHLPMVQIPSIKMPKVDSKAPQVDIRGPKPDLKDTKGEVSAPNMEVSLPTVELDAQVPSAKVEADLTLGDKEVASRDSKFKMPKLKMPSFDVSVPSQDLGTSMDVEVSPPKVRAEATLPSLGREVQAPEGAVQVPTADIDLSGEELEVSLPEGEVAVSRLKDKAERVKIKGQLPKVQMPSLKMPKVDIKAPQVDIKAPQVDIKGPKLDLKGAKGEVSTPDVEVSLPRVEVDAQVPGAKVEADLSLGDKEVASRDSKFKMPKFKMPSFGTSAPSKDLGTCVDVSVPKVRAEATLPSLGGKVQAPEDAVQVATADIDLPGGELEVSLPKEEVAVSRLKGKAEGVKIKGHLPKVHMPSLKIPTVDIKAPQVDIKGPKLDLKGAKGEVSAPDMEVSLPTVEVDAQVPSAKGEADLSMGDKDVAAGDSKFKMPKFKMPSFGTSVPSKSLEASVDPSLPKVQAEVSMPSIQADVKTSDMTIELPSADLDVKTASVGLKLPEGQVPEGELQEPSASGRLKGHLPKGQMPSVKMPKVDSKAPQVDIRGPILDLKGAKGEVSTPDMEVSLPSVKEDAQVSGAKVEADLSVGEKEVASRDSKFKMPKFKMPSFGVSAPNKDLGTSMDMEVSLPKARAEATLPSLERKVRVPEGAIQVPTADIDLHGGDLEVSLPEGEVAVSGLKGKAEGVRIKSQLPKMQMPSLKMPKVDIKAPQVDIKAPQVDIKGPKLDLKGAKGEVSIPDVEMSLPSMEVDAQVPGSKEEADQSLGDKEVATRDSKFKMPKFKMPSFSTSAPSKDLGISVDVSVPKVGTEATLPSLGGEVRAPEGAVQVATADIDLPGGELEVSLPEGEVAVSGLKGKAEGVKIKSQLPKMQMPRMKIPTVDIKVPQVDIKAPQVDIKGPKLDLKGAKGEVSAPDMEVSLPSVEVDAQVPDAKLEADQSLGDKEVAARDSKFKMPKFKIPSFGASVPSESFEVSVDPSLPKVQAEVSMPSIQTDIKTSEVTFERPSADLDVKTALVGLKIPEGQVPEGELQEPSASGRLKGHLPKVQMPSVKMPKVDFKAPQADIRGPKLDLKGAKGEVSTPDKEASLPAVEVDTQVPSTKGEADLSMGDKEVATRDSKFKMPKFKMPSFGMWVPSKDLGTSMDVDVSLSKARAEATLPSLGKEVRAPEGAIQVPTADIDLPAEELELSVPEGEVAVTGPKGKAEGVKIKGQLPKVQMPSLKMDIKDIKMPKVDIKAPQVDIKGPKLDLKGAKVEVSTPEVEMSLPSMEMDAQVPGAKVEADLSLGDKEVAARDSKFKMPKFKMPSFSSSVPSKDLRTSVDMSGPKVGVEATLPSLGREVLAPEGDVLVATADINLPGSELEVSLPEGEVAVSGLKGKAERFNIKGQLPNVQMPSLKMPTVDIRAHKVDIKAPQVDIKGPKLDLKGAKEEVRAPDVEVSLPSLEVDAQVPEAKLEADLSPEDKEVATRDSKFKMPKFKTPSFGASAQSKDLGTSVDVEVSMPSVRAKATLPSLGREVQDPEVAVQVPTADINLPVEELEVSLPEGDVAVSGLKDKAEGVKIKGQLPKVQMPSLKLPKVDIKAPQVDIMAPQVDIRAPKMDLNGAKGEVSAPKVEVSLPSVEVDTQVPSAKVEADLSLGDKEVAARDSKFKMPKFKMPSFGASAQSKDLGTSMDMSLPKVGAEATLPSLGGEVRTPEGAVQVPTADTDLPGGDLEVSPPEGEVAVSELEGKAEGVKIKGQRPKVQIPSLKMPMVDIKAPQVDIKGPKLDLKGAKGEVSATNVEASLPTLEVDAQVPGAKVEADLSMGDKEVADRDSKLKMPKFKMPSFGTSAPSKDLGTSMDVSLPKVGAKATLPSLGGEMKAPDGAVQRPTADIDLPGGELQVSLPEGEVAVSELKGKAEGVKFKGQLPKAQMPSLKMPKVDIKAPQVDVKVPQVDIKRPKLDLKCTKGEISSPDMVVSLPRVEVDAQVPGTKVEADLSLGDKEVAARDSKFKMPKFKMPSFGASAPSKSLEAPVDASLPKVQAEVSMSSIQADVKTCDMTIELPSADLDIKTGLVGLKIPEGQVPEGELQEPSATGGLKGHLPKMQMPSIKMPKVDLKTSQVDIKGPKLDLKGAKGEMSAPEVEVSLPSGEVDAQVPRTKVEADLSMGDKEVATRDSKFKMPSFGTSAPSKDLGTSVDILVPKVGAKATLPSLGGEVRAPEGAVHVPTADIDLPGGELEVSPPRRKEGVKIKGQLPKVQMPSLKMPKMDIKAPQVDIKASQVDIKGPKLDLKGAKGKVSTPDMEVSLPTVEVDAQVSSAKVEADLSLGDKEVAARDSKFKMPKFKMPSFGASAPSKSLEASVDASLPKVQAEVSMPSIQADVKTSDVTIELPSADLDIKTASVGLKLPEGQVPEGELQEPSASGRLKGHLPKVQMPSIKMPKLDIMGPKLDLKGAKGEVSTPDVEVSLPTVEVDAQVPEAKVEADLSVGDKEVAARDSKFKMPKFKMPSFGVSAPSKDLGTSVDLDVSVPKVGAKATLPSLGGEVRAPEGAVQVPTADINLPGEELEVSLPEGEVAVSGPKGKAEGVKIKGQLPKVQMPSLKMPKVDIKAPQVDIKGPKVDLKGAKGEVSAPDVEVSLPSVEVSAQVSSAKVEADLSLGDKEVAAGDSKFKMPKFKMPSFGTSAPSKSLEASVDASLPKVQAEVSMPSIQADVKTSDVTIELPSAHLDVKTASVGLKLPEGQVPKEELKEPSAAAGLKGHLPKVQMPSIKMPKVDSKAPQVDIKGPKLDLNQDAKGEVSAPDVEVSLPTVEVDAQVPVAKLDSSSGEVEVFSKAAKFKFPKISISSSRTSPSKPSLVSPGLDIPDKVTQNSLSSGLRDPVVSGGDQHAFHMEGDVALSVGKEGEKSKSKKSHFKLPKVFSPPGKADKGFVASAEETEVPLPVRASASPLESGHGEPLGTPVASVETSLPLSRPGWLSGPHGESSCLSPSEGVTLTKYQVTVPRGPVPSELPCETPSRSQLHAQLPSMAGAGDLPSSESILLSQPDGHTSPVDIVLPESYGRVTFPKFHRPKFRLSLPTSAAAVVEPGAAERAPPTSPPLAAQGLDSSVEEATAFPVPEGHLPPAGVSASTVAEGQAGTAGTSAVAPEEAPAEGAGRKGKGRPVTAPRLKLPSFSWSPKKGAESKADPGHSPAVTADALGSPPRGPVTPAEAGADVSLGKDGEAGAVRTPALAQLKVAPPGMEASTRGAGLPRGDPGLALAGSTDTASGKGGVGGAGTAAGPPEGADVSLHLPEAPVPSAGFVKPDLSPGDATVEGSLSTGHLPLPKHGLSLRDSTQEHGPGDSSASQLCGDVMASLVEDPLQPSPAVGSPERDAAVGEAPAGSRESWFRMPSLRLPGFGRPHKERVGSAGLGAQRPAPVTAGVQGEGEAVVGMQSPDACAPASEVDAAKSLQPPEAGADGAAVGSPASSYADVLRRDLDLHASVGPSASEVRVRPGAGSLPLQLHGVLAEPRGPPGEAGEPLLPGPAGQGLGRRAQGAEGPPSQPEGPVRLRASSTDVPSQVSVVNVGQVWEDSVLRVQFPKLKVPRFSFPAPSLEPDIFVPSVRELSSCPQSGPDTALLEQSPSGRGTSIPKAPVALGLSSEAAPICKVRVHIQGAEAASRKVAVHSTVTAGYTELSGPEAFPTQIVQESEVPASETQTPSRGFSLLKGRVPEPPPRARVHLVTTECGLRGRLREAQEPVPGADPVSGDLQPDTGEPFEIICPSVDMPGPPACSSDLHSGHGRADSCSDEEPAEILEFLPEEGQEAEEAEAPKAKPEGRRSSGLFRFWLPSIGFSSSASETSADSQADAQRPAPVQTQPEAQTPPSQEKGGWFRFPKLGFSSSATKKSKSEEEEVSLAEQSLQEEAGTFYDARESFSPEETGAGELAEAAGARRGSGTMVTSAARTELILLEQDGAASQQSAPRPATK